MQSAILHEFSVLKLLETEISSLSMGFPLTPKNEV